MSELKLRPPKEQSKDLETASARAEWSVLPCRAEVDRTGAGIRFGGD